MNESRTLHTRISEISRGGQIGDTDCGNLFLSDEFCLSFFSFFSFGARSSFPAASTAVAAVMSHVTHMNESCHTYE